MKYYHDNPDAYSFEKAEEFSFGIVPSLKILKPFSIERSHIILLKGNYGRGARHIFKNHRKEMLKLGLTSLEDVPKFVGMIVRERAKIYFEDNGRKNVCTLIQQSGKGRAVLQYYEKYEHWSVITAYTNSAVQGMKIGSIERF